MRTQTKDFFICPCTHKKTKQTKTHNIYPHTNINCTFCNSYPRVLDNYLITYHSFFCQEAYGLVHTTTMSANVLLTFHTVICKLQLWVEGTKSRLGEIKLKEISANWFVGISFTEPIRKGVRKKSFSLCHNIFIAWSELILCMVKKFAPLISCIGTDQLCVQVENFFLALLSQCQCVHITKLSATS